MLTKKTIQFFFIIGIIMAFTVPSALAGGAGGNGDPIAWFFWSAGAFDDLGKGSKATGRVTSYKPVDVADVADVTKCSGADYSTHLYITVELERDKGTELYFYGPTDDTGPFCATTDYNLQVLKLTELIEESIGSTIYWNSVKSVAWNDTMPYPFWEIFEFSITILP